MNLLLGPSHCISVAFVMEMDAGGAGIKPKCHATVAARSLPNRKCPFLLGVWALRPLGRPPPCLDVTRVHTRAFVRASSLSPSLSPAASKNSSIVMVTDAPLMAADAGSGFARLVGGCRVFVAVPSPPDVTRLRPRLGFTV